MNILLLSVFLLAAVPAFAEQPDDGGEEDAAGSIEAAEPEDGAAAQLRSPAAATIAPQTGLGRRRLGRRPLLGAAGAEDGAPASDEAPQPKDAAAPASTLPLPATTALPPLGSVRHARSLTNARRYERYFLIFDANAGRCQWVEGSFILDARSRECLSGDRGYAELAANGGAADICINLYNVYSIDHPFSRENHEQFVRGNPTCAAHVEHRNHSNPNFQSADRDGSGTLCEERGVGCAFIPAPDNARTGAGARSHEAVYMFYPDYGHCQWTVAAPSHGQGVRPCRPGDALYFNPAGYDYTYFCCSQLGMYSFTSLHMLGGAWDPNGFRYFLRDNPQCRIEHIDYSTCRTVMRR